MTAPGSTHSRVLTATEVLGQPGVKWIIVLEGINDIGIGSLPGAPPTDAPTVDDLIAAHKQIIERAHLHGIKAIGATLTPFVGAAYATADGATMREALNNWIRASKAYDAVIDFDAAVQDPGNPKQIRPSFNIRDHLHPNDQGYQAMAAAVDLRAVQDQVSEPSWDRESSDGLQDPAHSGRLGR